MEPSVTRLASRAEPATHTHVDAGCLMRVAVADTQPLLRAAIASELARWQVEVVREAADQGEALAALLVEPDVVVVGHSPPRLDAFALIAGARGERAPVGLVVLADADAPVIAREALRVGLAVACLPREATTVEIRASVLATATGLAPLPRRLAWSFAARWRDESAAAGLLTRRELDVLQLVATGKTMAEAASELFVSVATVKTYLRRVYVKLGVSTAAAAVAEAFRQGLIE